MSSPTWASLIKVLILNGWNLKIDFNHTDIGFDKDGQIAREAVLKPRMTSK